MATQDTGTAGGGPGGLPDAARQAIDALREEAGDLAGRATGHGRSMLARRKKSAARQVDSIADALHGTARELEGGEHAMAGRLVDDAADRLQAMGRQLREKDVDTLVHDVQDLGRRAPGAFFAGSVVAGFLLARFLKASSDRVAPRDAWRDAHADGRGPHDAAERERRGADLRSGTAADAAAVATGPSAGTGTGTVTGARHGL